MGRGLTANNLWNIVNVRAIRGGEKVPNKLGRPPAEDPKSLRIEIRMTESEAALLQECAERLGITRTKVINRGIQMVKSEIDK